MGKHSKVQPKKVSFLGSAGGIFVAMALAGGLFAASNFHGAGPFHNEANPPVEHPIEKPTQSPANMVATGTALANLPTTVPSLPGETPRVIIPVVPPQTPTQPPTLSPGPNPSPGTPNVSVQARVDTPVVGVDTDVQVAVPLLGSAVELVDETVTPVLDTVKDLLR